jgi:signal transduction histidine kinase/ActR/RegA family two-component response regulator
MSENTYSATEEVSFLKQEIKVLTEELHQLRQVNNSLSHANVCAAEYLSLYEEQHAIVQDMNVALGIKIEESKIANERIKRSQKFAFLLNQVSSLAGQTSDPDVILQFTVESLTSLLAWDIGHVYKLSLVNSQLLEPSNIWYFSNPERFRPFHDITMETLFIIGEGMPGEILQTGQPVWYRDYSSTANFLRAQKSLIVGIHGAVGFPVKLDGKVVSIVEFFTQEIIDEDPEVLRLIQEIGEHISRVIEKQRANLTLLKTNEVLKKELIERKKIETQLIQTQKMQALGTLTSGIAHDFNNILWMILGNSEMLLTELHHNPTSAELLGDVQKAALRAKDLVQQLMDFSRQSPQNVACLMPSLLVKETLKLMKPSIPFHIEVSTDFCSTQNTILGDANKFHQIIMNLITNAYQAIGSQPGKISVRTWETKISENEPGEEESKKPGNYMVLEIMDSGSGMSLEVKERLFEPFFTTKPTGEGTGLGLSIVHGIISDMGGYIEVDSEIGQGTCFRLFLPIANKSETNEADTLNNQPKKQETPTESKNIPAKSKGVHILLADDEKMIQTMLKKHLEQAGFSVSAFNNGEEALKAFNSNKESYDVVVTDYAMPKMTGTDLAKEIANLSPDIPIIIATGNSTAIKEEDLQIQSLRQVLKKPIELKELEHLVIHLSGDLNNPDNEQE